LRKNSSCASGLSTLTLPLTAMLTTAGETYSIIGARLGTSFGSWADAIDT